MSADTDEVDEANHTVSGRRDPASRVDGVVCGTVLRTGFAAVQEDNFVL